MKSESENKELGGRRCVHRHRSGAAVFGRHLPRSERLNINVSLVPIVVGAAVYGWKVGAWLGLMSGAAILVAGQAADFLRDQAPSAPMATVLVKGTLCGLIAGLVYTALSKKNRWVAIIVAAVVCPVVNTGVFLLGCLLFFMDTLNGWAAALGYESAGAYMVLGLAGGNFLLEIGVNVVLAPVISRLIAVGKKK